MTKLSLTVSVAAVALAITGQVAVAQDGSSPKDKFIVGGSPATEGQLPWQVALIDGAEGDQGRDQFCGGSIVDAQWILTAAHCVDNGRVQRDPKRVDIIAGTLAYASGGERADAELIIVHPNWDADQFDFDAALIKLKSPLKLGTKIPLAAAGAEVPVDFPVRVSGWGATLESGPGSDKLLFVDVPAVSNTCNKPESYDGRVTDQMLCAGAAGGGIDSCQGDSGGPAVSKLTDHDELVGIVSWGFGCARPLLYGVFYARVSSISEWATEAMANN